MTDARRGIDAGVDVETDRQTHTHTHTHTHARARARALGSDIIRLIPLYAIARRGAAWRGRGRSATGCETVKAKKHSPPKRAIYYPQPFKYRTVREEIHI